jgi:hypothetical protein
MGSIMVSPADPLFWMHHAQIDRLWSIWQAVAGNARKGPTLRGRDAILDPWTERASDMQSITRLDYSYEPQEIDWVLLSPIPGRHQRRNAPRRPSPT